MSVSTHTMTIGNPTRVFSHEAPSPHRQTAAFAHAEDVGGEPNPALGAGTYRLCYRLTGNRSLATDLTQRAMAAAAHAPPTTSHEYALAAAAVRLVLESTPSEIGNEFDDHTVTHPHLRGRLRRDLARHPSEDQVVLVLRHLVGHTPAAIASLLSLDESRVREVTSRWLPSDGTHDSSALLRGIDNWISHDLGSSPKHEPASELSHLDDSMPPPLAAL